MCLFTILEAGVYIYKTNVFYYDVGRISWELFIFILFEIIEITRLKLAGIGNRSMSVSITLLSFLFLPFSVLFNVWLLIWQLFTIGLEVYLIGVFLCLAAVNLATGLYAVASFNN